MVAAAVDEGVCLLEFTEPARLEAQVEAVRRRLGRDVVVGEHPHLVRLAAELRAYFAGELRAFTVPLVSPGTPFEERVWDALRTIPYGQTRSYVALADRLGVPDGQRAVGRANGLNPIAIVTPCHRVVNKDGRLGGYGGGLWRKRWLLDLEQGLRPLFPECASA
jgi:AraC family transcriptional regulator of adaptative response/methylated-DNA-[protein]-cysteine methyltransferase